MKKKISTILIIIGVLCGAVPLTGQLYTQYREDKMINDWLNSDDAQTAESEDQQGSSTENAVDSYNQLQDIFAAENTQGTTTQSNSAGTSATSVKPVKTVQQKVIGVIKISKIKVKSPIVEGVKSVNLKVGVGHIPGTAGLGQAGNCALAGHRSYTFGRFFNRLDELKIGDMISIITRDGEYKYKVYEKTVVLPSDVSVLKGSKNESVLTLITCTPIYVATHRLIVKARLESGPQLQP